MTIPSILSAIAALAAVLLVVLLAGRGARMLRLARPGGAGRLRVQETLALDPRRRLHLVVCDGREVLLLTGAQDLVVGWLPGTAP
jgi:flagellar protein FliO/FliZ